MKLHQTHGQSHVDIHYGPSPYMIPGLYPIRPCRTYWPPVIGVTALDLHGSSFSCLDVETPFWALSKVWVFIASRGRLTTLQRPRFLRNHHISTDTILLNTMMARDSPFDVRAWQSVERIEAEACILDEHRPAHLRAARK